MGAEGPAAFISLASEDGETVLSAVTTTRPAASSTYQAVPSTSAFRMASLIAESCSGSAVRVGAAAAPGAATAVAVSRPRAAASRRKRRVLPVRGVVRVVLTDLLLRG
ncbi:hypothetical protein GCM10010519_70050 [Streptomyces lactacystinicus]